MSDDDNNETVAASVSKRKLGKLYAKKVSQRKGHRAYATRIVHKVNQTIEALEDNSDDRDSLVEYKIILNDKLDILQGYDEDILEFLNEEDEIEDEISKSSDVRSEILSVVSQIDRTLKVSRPDTPAVVTPPPAREPSIPAGPPPTTRNRILPKLEIEPFTGDPIKFQSFIDNFHASVHSDTSISQVIKFTYLRSLLQGTALAAIDGLSLTNDNYEDALTILNERFGNKQLLISTNIERLLEIKPVASIDNAARLRDVYNKHIY